MGVKGLWTVLGPTGEKKSLWELKDQTVAVDLSGWICENQSVDFFNSNLFIRNLFFRTTYLLLLGVKPIFILDGKAPTLKLSTIEMRKRRRKMLLQSKTECNSRIGNRSRLNGMQKQCEELLKCLGLRCYYSEGEADALCATLNEKGLVDGIISQDSDCFLYGAKTVYKNFHIGSNGGSVEMYNMSSVESKLSLGRNKLIAFSLLCGCDYNEYGIAGIGKESTLKYLATLKDSEVLARISSWRIESSNEDESETNEDNATWKLETSIKQKALKNPLFPFTDVQAEFLENYTDVSEIVYQWNKPNMKSFVILMERKLAWSTDYATEKFLPVMARWHLLFDSDILKLDCIVKKRTLRNVLSYEVKWEDFNYTTIEPASILKFKYHQIIEDFVKCSKKEEKSDIRGRKKNHTKIDMRNIANRLNKLDLNNDELHTARPQDRQPLEDSLTFSDFECTAEDLLELSFIVESIASVR